MTQRPNRCTHKTQYNQGMPVDSAHENQQAHRLIDSLGPEQLSAVGRLLEVMSDPVSRSLANAALEGEEITPETAAELDQARASLERGEGIPHDQILREFGL